MAKRHYLDIVIVKEKLSTGELVYVAHCTSLGIASQGPSIEEATANIKEAINLYLEECPEKLDEMESEYPPTFSFVEVTHNAKIASIVRD
ncbi:TPA: type II toxin-antitoxin system HicB family antitoxin [Candidatus Woesearchaeota archaeon]|nr:type II toxin-antitoxin system HicB family antitoxin [Candidatus Woesearchaeota archaeon]HIG93360.1 type II toxin-antitoxin system HicB family antitoxin [Candidatus Woesearchaeota archaeon]